MRKILVTGATGFIGIEVSRQLADAGMMPRLMVRRPLRGIMLKNLRAEIMQGDLTSPRSLNRVLSGVDVVIHLGARAAFEHYKYVAPSIVNGSMHLMKAAAAAGVKHFVFGGSLLVYRDTASLIDQQTTPVPLSGYGRAKLEAERRLSAFATKAGIRFVSLRLPHVYGAHSLLFDQVRHGRIMFPGKGDNRFAHLHVKDAARCLIRAAENDTEGIWVIADEESCSWNDFFETTRTYYPRLRVAHVPRGLSFVGTRFLDGIFGIMGKPNPYPSGAVASWNLRLPVTSGTIHDVLGLSPAYPSIHDGIPEVLDDAISFYWLPSNLDRV
jgi:nucleoside-diphosphate-sugar epimerase